MDKTPAPLPLAAAVARHGFTGHSDDFAIWSVFDGP